MPPERRQLLAKEKELLKNDAVDDEGEGEEVNEGEKDCVERFTELLSLKPSAPQICVSHFKDPVSRKCPIIEKFLSR